MRFVLASASPTRLRVLRDAGLDPEVVVSGVDEDDVTGAPEAVAGELALRKARAVAASHRDALVLGCDSVIEVDGEARSKPSSADEAILWWKGMRGRTVRAWTGHALLLGDRTATRTTAADVHIGEPTDDEIARYVATGEPDGAAGAFRHTKRASAFIEGVSGHPGTVSGVSMPAVRAMLRELDIEVTDLWV